MEKDEEGECMTLVGQLLRQWSDMEQAAPLNQAQASPLLCSDRFLFK